MFKVYYNEYRRMLKKQPSISKLKQLKESFSVKEVRIVWRYCLIYLFTYVIYLFNNNSVLSCICMIECFYFAYKLHNMEIDSAFQTEFNAVQSCIDRDVMFLGVHGLLDKNYIEWLIRTGKKNLSFPSEWNRIMNLIKATITTLIVPLLFLEVPYWINFSELPFPNAVIFCSLILVVSAFFGVLYYNIISVYKSSFSSNAKLQQFIDNLEYIELNLGYYIKKFEQINGKD